MEVDLEPYVREKLSSSMGSKATSCSTQQYRNYEHMRYIPLSAVKVCGGTVAQSSKSSGARLLTPMSEDEGGASSMAIVGTR